MTLLVHSIASHCTKWAVMVTSMLSCVTAQSTVIQTSFQGYLALKEHILQALQDAVDVAIPLQVNMRMPGTIHLCLHCCCSCHSRKVSRIRALADWVSASITVQLCTRSAKLQETRTTLVDVWSVVCVRCSVYVPVQCTPSASRDCNFRQGWTGRGGMGLPVPVVYHVCFMYH